MSQSNIVKNLVMGIAVVAISTVMAKYIPQAEVV